MNREFRIRDVEILRTGADGGHAYARGNCEYEGGPVSVTALMADKIEEAGLLEGEIVLSAEVWDFTPGAGLLLSECRIIRGA